MATIKSEFSQFVSGVSSFVGDAKDRITNLFKGIVNQASAAIGSLIPGSVIGINVNKVPEMVSTIEAEVKAINDHLDQVNQEADPAQAFADPEMQDACRAYIGGVMDACKAYTSQMLKLADKLVEVKEYYEANQAKQTSTLRQAGVEASSSVDAYTRQK